MKKLLVLALSVCLVIGSALTVSASNDTSVTGETPNLTLIEVIEYEGQEYEVYGYGSDGTPLVKIGEDDGEPIYSWIDMQIEEIEETDEGDYEFIYGYDEDGTPVVLYGYNADASPQFGPGDMFLFETEESYTEEVSENPKTGDASATGFATAVVVVAAGCIVFASRKLKRA